MNVCVIPFFECDRRDPSLCNGDGFGHTLDKGTGDAGIYLADILLVVHESVLQQLGDHDEVARLFDELLVSQRAFGVIVLDLRQLPVNLLDGSYDPLLLDDEVLFGHCIVAVQVSSVVWASTPLQRSTTMNKKSE